ncbi:hypothetical protein [Alicyclobacillus sp. ALC3]|nr:hypothetical protein [Alicyclobacillus sp. ALC3]
MKKSVFSFVVGLLTLAALTAPAMAATTQSGGGATANPAGMLEIW